MHVTPHPEKIAEGTQTLDKARGGLALSRELQLRLLVILGGVAVLSIGTVLSVAALSAYFTHPVAGPPPAAPGTFRPTPEQMRNLTVAAVALRPFRSEEITEGAIAVDDDLTTPVFSPYSGRVSRLAVKLGDVVAKGAALMTVETPEIVLAQNDAVVTSGAAEAAAAQFKIAAGTEERTRALYEIKGAALKDVQQAQADLATARTAARSADATRDAARNRLRIYGESERDIDALLAGKGGGGSQGVVAAPIAGTVIQRQVGLGQFIQANAAAPVFAIGDLSKVWLVANVREDAAGQVHVGQAVEVRVGAYPTRVFKARLTGVGPVVDPAQHRLPVRAEIDNADGALTPQMFATFSIATSDDAPAPAVPAAAVIAEGALTRVWVVGGDGSLALRAIHTGRAAGTGDDRTLEVTSGLKAGEKVVVAGALFIDRAAQAD